MKQLKEQEYEEFQQYLYNKKHGYIWTPDTLEIICGGNDNVTVKAMSEDTLKSLSEL